MPILVYNKDKIYNPKDYKNVFRREMQKSVKMNYIKRPIEIPALNILLKIPGMKIMFNLIMYSGVGIIKLLGNNKKEILNSTQVELLESKEV